MDKSVEKKEKPRYNMFQNTMFMIQTAATVKPVCLVQCLTLAVLATAISVVQLYISPAILHRVEEGSSIVSLLWTIALFTGALFILSGAQQWIKSFVLFWRVEIRLFLIRRLHYQYCITSYPNIRDPEISRRLKTAMKSVDGNSDATEGIWDTLTEMVQNLAGFVIYLMLLSSLDPVLMGLVIITAAVSFFASNRIHEWGYLHRDEKAELTKKMNYIEWKSYDRDPGKDIRIFGMRGWLEEIFQKYLRLYDDFVCRRERAYFAADALDAALSLLRNGLAYYYLITLTLREGLPASTFLLYFTAVGGFSAWITGILAGVSDLYKKSLDISVLREFFDLPEPFNIMGGKALPPAEFKSVPELELRNVSFRYPVGEKEGDTSSSIYKTADAASPGESDNAAVDGNIDGYVLRNINLTIHPGEKIAIVGLNGAGKTTLIKILAGFYDPTEGEVLLNGTNIKEYNRRDYYKLFTAVFQQFSILPLSIGVNVAQAYDERIDELRVLKCMEKAGLTELTGKLSDGLNTHITRDVYEDGLELSGGEIQRLMLARALYKDAPVLLLDEPTAALDPLAESDIYRRYNELCDGKTSIFISHRLASTRFCDRILFLSDGTIKEEGTHEELLARKGGYASLFEIQSRYYKEKVEGNDV